MNLRLIPGVLLLLVLAMLPLPVSAQESEDEDEESGFGYVVAELSTWIAQPAGLGYSAATRHEPSNPFSTNVLSPDIGTRSEVFYKVGYVMPGEMGTFLLSYYDHIEDDTRLGVHDPGNFLYGESLAHPLFAGYSYDGLSDFFDSTYATQLTDFRFDLVRKAFERPKVSANWSVGVRRIKHNRTQSATYAALVPPIPALLPPLGGPFNALNPAPDSATVSSSYTGRGLEAGMEFKIPLIRNRLTLDAGFSIGLIRGDIDAAYRSQTRYYVLELEGEETLLLPPFDEFTQTRPGQMAGEVIPLAEDIEQRTLQIGLDPNNISTSSDVLETHVGLRWQAWKDFTLSVGFRSSRFTNVGVDLRPQVATITGPLRVEDGEVRGVNLENVTEVQRSATYEGIYLGVGYKY